MGRNNFLARSRSGRLVVPLVVVLVLGLGGILTIAALQSGDDDASAAANQPSPSTGPSAEASPVVPDQDVPEVLVLDTVGTELVSGMWVGFDHDLTGAISAGVEYWSTYSANLDPDRGEALGAAIFSESMLADLDTEGLRAKALDSRESIGVPAEGEVPEGIDLNVAFSNYQTYGYEADRVNLLLLGEATVYTDDGLPQTSPVLNPLVMVWESGDWKIDGFPFGELDYQSLLADPGSLEATELGWSRLTR
ncbi:hypothetical protein [Glycomyces sp. NRRL B-16210]|uniref:hypothetical protein n=1 Tax=Glycomyces sp. NRRL B-16210 TaxID=1463821 RepID=UPI0004C0FAF7|nr:hypothetical protein [Glycomyces sp. NRRL B-16210]